MPASTSDYVLGFTDRELLQNLQAEPSNRSLRAACISRRRRAHHAAVRERWKFIEPTLKKAPVIKIVPMLSSIGCPYTCSFCIDSSVPYQPLDFESMKEDLRFLRTKFQRPRVAWHDPNFGVKFDEVMDAIEEAVPPNSVDFIAESSLSLLSEGHSSGCSGTATHPSPESWYDLGNKSARGSSRMEKVPKVSEHINMIQRYIPISRRTSSWSGRRQRREPLS
jgi:hypothetical protein